MRTVGATLKQAIRDGYFAFLVKITTRDGTIYSYTDHDRPIIRAGVTYNPAPGLAPLKTYRTADQKVDSQEFAAAWIDAPEEDLLAGKFDEAEFVIGRTDWRDEADGEVMIDFADQFSNITWTKEGFKAEVQNSFRKLRKIIGFKTSATCPYEFGSTLDANNPRACGFNLASVTFTGAVAPGSTRSTIKTGLLSGTPNVSSLIGGKLTLTGVVSGSFEIKGATDNSATTENYVAVGSNSANDLRIYKVTPGSVSVLPTFDSSVFTEAGNTINGVNFSPSGEYVATHAGGQLYVYKRAVDAYTNLGAPLSDPFITIRSVAWSQDSKYLAVARFNSLLVFVRSGDVFTELSNVEPIGAAGNPNDCAFLPDTETLIVTTDVAPHVVFYTRSGDTFTKRTSMLNIAPPSGGVFGDHKVAVDPTGLRLAFTNTQTAPLMAPYLWTGSQFVRQTNPVTAPVGSPGRSSFSYEGKYLAVSHSGSPYVTIYRTDVSPWLKLTNPSTLPTGAGQSAKFSQTTPHLIVSHSTAPYVTMYRYTAALNQFNAATAPVTNPGGQANDASFFFTPAYSFDLFLRTTGVPLTGSVEIKQGCAKTVTACKGYSNFTNFGGDPFIDPETQFK